MIGKDNIRPTDINIPEKKDIPEIKEKLEIPSIDDLKVKIEDIFLKEFENEFMVEISEEADEVDTGFVILDDGTVIELPSERQDTINVQNWESESLGEANEEKPTRELTEEERDYLKETLGWTDKQLDKCSIHEDGVIHYRTDREDMEGKTGENGVRYERKTVDIHGVKVEGVFPVFESLYDVQLPASLEKSSNPQQFKECNRQLKEAVAKDPELRNSFTEEQLEDIGDGTTPEGYVWHHNEETGKMQLVKVEEHDRTQGGAAHTGGKSLWGGGY